MEPRFALHSSQSFNKILFPGYYRNSFGLSFASLLKAFTTQIDGNPVFPHYASGVGNTLNSSILNPYGTSSTFEGLVHGDDLPVDLEGDAAAIARNKGKIRSYGVKAPMTMVGWGYDIFGYPAPNAVSGWSDSGAFGGSTPTGSFAGSGSTPITEGGNVPFEKYLAAPLDVRYDPHRKVWTGNYGIYPAIIFKAYNNGTPITDFEEPLFAESITYDAYVFDGRFSGIMVTGVRTDTPRPKVGTYKVFPNITGQLCVIANKWHTPNLRPGFGILTPEVPYAQDCSTDTINYLLELIQQGSGITYPELANTPLGPEYGGTGFDSFASGQMLVGNSVGTLSKHYLVAGTGLSVVLTSGYATLQLASGVQFLTSDGVNTTITALSGLTTPLSIGQGGTGSSTKNFVDLSNSQSVSGIKSWISQAQFSVGSSGSPGISWNAFTNYGLYINSVDRSIQVISSGTAVQKIYTTGIIHNQSTQIRPTSNYYPPLMVFQRQSLGAMLPSGLETYSTEIQTWHNASGFRVANVDNTGYFGARGFRVYNTGYTKAINLVPTGDFSADYDIVIRPVAGTLALLSDVVASTGGGITTIPSGISVTGLFVYDTDYSNYVRIGITGNLNTNYGLQPQGTGGMIATRGQVPFFAPWNEEPSGLINGVNRLFVLKYNVFPTGNIMLFKSAIKQRMGPNYDFILSSGNLINFNVTSIPASGDWLEAIYQHDLYGDYGYSIPAVPITPDVSVAIYGGGAEA